MKLGKRDLLVVSVMLFALFFGAGNLIFPPFLGQNAGRNTLPAMVGFLATAVILPVLGVVVVARFDGLERLGQQVDKRFALVFTVLIYISIGPGLGIPRAASVPFEMAVAPYLPECLDTLLPQADDSTEVILVDDGATDGSGSICDTYAARFAQNVRVIHQPNRGVAAARNTGLRAASGAYIVWVDPDDLPAADLLTSIKENIDGQDMLIFDYWERRGDRLTWRKLGEKNSTFTVEALLYELSRDDPMTSVLWNKVIKREHYLRHTFDESMRCMEDYDILYQIAMDCTRIAYLAKPLYQYRILDSGLVRTPNLEIAYQCFEKSKQRYEALKAVIGHPSRLGICIQAKGFLCKYYICGEPAQWADQANICRRALKACRKEICTDAKLPLAEKLKLCAIGVSAVGRKYAEQKKDRP